MEWADAETFLGRCRFCQTRRGSFVVTVACPLNAVPGAGHPDQSSFVPEFTRRITSRLISSVRLLEQCVANDDLDAAAQTRDQHTMLSANLCDALSYVAPVRPGDNVTLAGRPTEDGEREGSVTLRLTDESGESFNALVNLNSTDHRSAHGTYYGRTLALLRGIVKGGGGRTWCIDPYSDFRVIQDS